MLAYLADLLTQFADWLAATTGTRLALPIVGGFAGFLVAVAQTFFSHRRRRMEADDEFRKISAKRWNEHIKLYGSFSNTLGIAIVGAAFIVPHIKDGAWPQGEAQWWVLVGVCLPASGQFVIRFMQSES